MRRSFWDIYQYHGEEAYWDKDFADGGCKCINPTLIRTVYIAVQKSLVRRRLTR